MIPWRRHDPSEPTLDPSEPTLDPPEPASHPAEPAKPDEELIAFATRLFELARRGEARALSAYVDAGVSPNLCNQSGDTLLMLAAYHGHADTVRALAARGADPDRANDRGQTPLAGAVFKDDPEVIRTLIAAGADPAAGAPSALATAAMFERADLAALLAGER